MPGPSPKYSKADRAKQGNPGRRPSDVGKQPADVEIHDFFPDAPDSVPFPPEFLTNEDTELNRQAVNIWQYLAAYMHEARLLRSGDSASLGRLCRYLAEWSCLTSILDAEGFTTQGSQGIQRHPALLARNAIETQIEKLESKFGLNPDDRLKLTKDFANSLKNLPLAGKSAPTNESSRGPVGFLNKPKEGYKNYKN